MLRTSEALGPRGPSEERGRVLVVDDDVGMRQTIGALSESHDFSADQSDNVRDALETLGQGNYRVIVTDLGTSDGVELMRRAHELDPELLFIIVTDDRRVTVPTDEAFRRQVVSIMSKPCDPEELVHALERALSMHGSKEHRRDSMQLGPLLQRALLVEDSDRDALLISAQIAACYKQIELEHVTRLDDALERLESARFDVVMSDLVLPDAHGVDAIVRIRKAAPTTALVALSGLGDEGIAEAALQSGAQDFVPKQHLSRSAISRAISLAYKRKRAEQRLLKRALSDPLTGLANRAYFEQRLGYTLARALRNDQQFAVIYIDLDNFKPVNDELGHAAGDAVLVEVGRRLKAGIRAYDLAARLGGDEFAVIIDSPERVSDVYDVAERVLKSLRRPHNIGDEQVSVTGSLGLAIFPDDGMSPDELIQAADAAMYRSKSNGRDALMANAGRSGERNVLSLDRDTGR